MSTKNSVMVIDFLVLNPKKTIVLKVEREGVLRFSLKTENYEKSSYLLFKIG